MLDVFLKHVSDFESLARLEIEIVLRTNGSVKLVIKDLEADRQQSHKFDSIRAADAWVCEALNG
jgi:hypothetical protein